MIVENSLEIAPYAKKCREFLFAHNVLEELHFFPGLFLFEEAAVQSTIFVARKSPPQTPYGPKRLLHDSPLHPMTFKELPIEEFSSADNVFRAGRLPGSLRSLTIPLGTLCYINKGATYPFRPAVDLATWVDRRA